MNGFNMALISSLVPGGWANKLMMGLPCQSDGVRSQSRKTDSTIDRGFKS